MVENLSFNLVAHATTQPNAIAIVHGDRRITYSVLWQMVKAIVSYLQYEGFRPGDRMAILLRNSPEFIATYYAIMAMGGIAVALNFAAKQRNLLNWLQHSGSSWLVADSKHPELFKLLETYKGKVLLSCFENECNQMYIHKSLESIFDQYDNREIEIYEKAKGGTPAAIIYTSGTTGCPKGVTLSHDNLVYNTDSIVRYLGLKNTDSIVNVLPFYYSYGNSILHTHISVGGTVVLANNMVFPKKILELIEQEQVTGFSGVPSTFALLLNKTNIHEYKLSSLNYMTQAGGPMPPSSIERLLAEVPNVKFYVMYGQTEATARLSFLPPGRLIEKKGSIGIAIPGVELEIRNKKGEKVLANDIGEIYARGENIMLGYWSDEKLTKTVITDGWLRTGDLAYYDEDEYLYIVGRVTEMIKTGANRVSPKEIEEVIVEIKDVEEVAVIGCPDEILGQVIKAFIVKKIHSDLSVMQILAYCKDNLEQYKIPKYVKFVEKIPKTASGKVQRYLLH